MDETKSSSLKDTMFKITQEQFDSSTISANLSQNFIVTTADRVKLCLIEHQDILESRRNWIAPVGIFISLLLNRYTIANYKKFWGLNPEIWQAIFLILLIASLCWSIFTAFRAVLNCRKGGVDNLIKKLKKGSSATGSSCVSDKIQNGHLIPKFEIIEATYGTQKAKLDITEELRKMVVDNKLETKASNAIKGDPDPGTVKQLSIKYKFKGIPWAKEFREGKEVVIP